MTEEEFLGWKSMPETQRVFSYLRKRRDDFGASMVSAATTSKDTNQFCLQSIRSAGIIIGLNELLEMQYQDLQYS